MLDSGCVGLFKQGLGMREGMTGRWEEGISKWTEREVKIHPA